MMQQNIFGFFFFGAEKKKHSLCGKGRKLENMHWHCLTFVLAVCVCFVFCIGVYAITWKRKFHVKRRIWLKYDAFI